MQRTFLLMLILLFAFPIFAQNEYDSDTGVSFTYPSGWEIEEEDDIIYLYSDETEIVIYVVETYGDPLDFILEEAFFPFDETLTVYTDEIEFDTTGNGFEAAYYFYEDYDAEYDVDLEGMITVVAASDDYAIVVDAYAYEGALAEIDIVEDVIDSVYLSDEGGSSTSAPIINAQPELQPFTDVSFEYSECISPLPDLEIEGDTFDCGWLYVPENRENPVDEIALYVVILRSTSGSPAADPIVYLEGGPGGSPTYDPSPWAVSSFRNDRDIILIDQRGTGYSQPSLNCPEVEEEIGNDPDRACYERLVGEGVDISAYNSRESAADIEALRVALGYDQITLYGISYGTRLALTVMRDYPQGLRAVVIDSVYPPQVNGYDEQVYNGARAFRVVFDNCEADAACNAAFPDLETRFTEAVMDANDNPPVVHDPEYDEEFDMYGDDVVNDLFSALYDSYSIPGIPAAMDAFANGDYDAYIDFIYYGIPEVTFPELPYIDDPDNGLDDAEGQFQAVECYEEVHFNSIAGVESYNQQAVNEGLASLAIVDALSSGMEEQFDQCEFWASDGVSGNVENMPVVSDVPTLVISGEYDPITPPEWGRLAAENLSNGYFYEFPGLGHGFPEIPCPESIITQFLANPQAQPDSSCISSMSVDYYIP